MQTNKIYLLFQYFNTNANEAGKKSVKMANSSVLMNRSFLMSKTQFVVKQAPWWKTTRYIGLLLSSFNIHNLQTSIKLLKLFYKKINMQ